MGDDFDWLDQPQKDDGIKLHADFKKNQAYAQSFIDRVSVHLVEGLRLAIGGSTTLTESVLWVNYSPPIGIPMGNFGYCINLNAPHADVKATLEWYFNAYHKMAKNVEQKYSQPKVVQLRAAI